MDAVKEILYLKLFSLVLLKCLEGLFSLKLSPICFAFQTTQDSAWNIQLDSVTKKKKLIYDR